MKGPRWSSERCGEPVLEIAVESLGFYSWMAWRVVPGYAKTLWVLSLEYFYLAIAGASTLTTYSPSPHTLSPDLARCDKWVSIDTGNQEIKCRLVRLS